MLLLFDRGAWWAAVHGVSQARMLERVAISFSRASSQPRDYTHVSCTAGGFFTIVPSGKTDLPSSITITNAPTL